MATVIDSLIVELTMNTAGLKQGAQEYEIELQKLKEASSAAGKALNDALKLNLGPAGDSEIKRLRDEASKAKTNLVAFQGAAKTALKATADEAVKAAHAIKQTEQATKDLEKAADGAKEGGKDLFRQLTEAALGFFAIIGGSHELKELFSTVVEGEVKTGRLAGILHTNVEELGAWQEAVKFSGGTVEGFQSSVLGLGEKISVLGTKLRGAKQAAMALGQVGLAEVEVKGKNVFEVLGLLQGKFQDIDSLKAIKLGSILGLDQATVLMLQQNKEALADLIGEMKELGVPTEAETKSSAELHHEMLKLEIAQKAVARIIVEQLKPAVVWLVGALREIVGWAKQNPDEVKRLFVALAVGIAAAGLAAIAAAPAVLAFASPILAVAAAFAVLGYALQAITEDWGDIGEDGVDTWTRISVAVGTTIGFILGAMDNLVETQNDAWGVIAGIASLNMEMTRKSWHRLMEDISGDTDTALDGISSLWEWLGVIANRQQELMTGMSFSDRWAQIKRDGASVWDAIQGSAKTALNWIENKLFGIIATLAKLAQAFHLPDAAMVLTIATAGQAATEGQQLKATATEGKPAGRSQDEIFAAHGLNPQGGQNLAHHAQMLKDSADRLARMAASTPRASAAMALHPSTVNHRSDSKSVKNETHIDTINVNAPDAKDAHGIASEMHKAIQSRGLVDQSDYGVD